MLTPINAHFTTPSNGESMSHAPFNACTIPKTTNEITIGCYRSSSKKLRAEHKVSYYTFYSVGLIICRKDINVQIDQ